MKEEIDHQDIEINDNKQDPGTPLDKESILQFPSSSSSNSSLYSKIECTLDLDEAFILGKSIDRSPTERVHCALYRDECDIALKEFHFARLTEQILCRLLGHFVNERSNRL